MARSNLKASLLIVTAVATLPLLTVTICRQAQAQAQPVTEHPFIAPGEIKTETCLGCHPDKKEGKFVHTAVASGCESCHQATSDQAKEKTTVTLMAQGGELCAMCHETQKEVVVHKPYQLGQCLVCHEAHSSAYKAQLRANVNSTCLSCHGENQKDVKISKEIQKVSMLGVQSIPFAEYDQAPKLELDQSGTRGHPMPGHPVAGKNVKGKEGEINCISCHAHHCSPQAKRIRTVANSEIGICGACHD